ncbi:hypothetical protein BDZ89DRAFT_1067839 [Hymenopellis radicata]|nr:hypothetical protein BDZ89DRAFT_1067839 [Hymenopellis radicata]
MTSKLLLVLIETKNHIQRTEGLVSAEWNEIGRIYASLGITSARFYATTDSDLLGASLSEVAEDPDLHRITTSFAESSTLTALRVKPRLYNPYLSGPLIPPSDETVGHRLVINAMTPSPSSENSFNSWYAEEHVPLLSAVPFWISSNRYLLAETSSAEDDAPAYLALHEWADEKAFKTPEFKKATDTPWRTEVIGQVVKKERWVLEYRGSCIHTEDAVA